MSLLRQGINASAANHAARGAHPQLARPVRRQHAAAQMWRMWAWLRVEIGPQNARNAARGWFARGVPDVRQAVQKCQIHDVSREDAPRGRKSDDEAAQETGEGKGGGRGGARRGGI
uniref:(northern house mosquito) hypothetical protein n=1 Tax=Culex pipiens TaxID=7175 RepID=A0A8D8C955_CULPI